MKSKELLEVIRKDFRCASCGKLIFKGKLWGDYNIQFICPRCKNKIEISKFEKATKNK